MPLQPSDHWVQQHRDQNGDDHHQEHRPELDRDHDQQREQRHFDECPKGDPELEVLGHAGSPCTSRVKNVTQAGVRPFTIPPERKGVARMKRVAVIVVALLLGTSQLFAQEMHFKNVQLRKDLTPEQLDVEMDLMRASLGVGCDFCHVNKDKEWDFASDAKSEK